MLVPLVPTVAVAVLTALLCGATVANTGYTDADIEGLVIAGGFYEGPNYDSQALDNVETLDMEPLPWLPAQVYQNTLTAVGPMLYSCGGHNISTHITADCYVLDTLLIERKWSKDLTLLVAMTGHTAAAVSSHIWFTYEDGIYDYDTLTGLFRYFEAPFSFLGYPCVVSNFTHSFILGVGKDYNEVWINSKDFSPEEWQLVYVMSEPIDESGCLWYNDEIFITGGEGTESRVRIFNITSLEVKPTFGMNVARDTHKMALIDGKPAVIGGYNTENNEQLSSIESYNSSTKSWTVDKRTLSQARSWFGLARPTY